MNEGLSAPPVSMDVNEGLNAPPVSMDVNEGLDAPLMEILERYELTVDQLGDAKLRGAVQNLLQQLPEEGAKSRNFLLALSGEPLAQKNAADLGTAIQDIGLQNAGTEVLRAAALNANAEMTVEQMPATSSGAANMSASAEKSSANMPAETRIAQTVKEPTAAPLQPPQKETTLTVGRAAAELVGENLVTDENTANPLTVLAQRTLRHDMTQSGDRAPLARQTAGELVSDSIPQGVDRSASAVVSASATPESSLLNAANTRGRAATEMVGAEPISTDEAADMPESPAALTQRAPRDTEGDAAGKGAGQEQQPNTSSRSSETASRTAEEEIPTPQVGQQNLRPSFGAVDLPQRPMETAPQPAQPIAAQTGAGAAPVQEVASPTAAQESPRPQPDYEIPRQIVEQARLLRTLTDTQMVIRLKPEHLGELTLRVALGSDGAVQASFHSDNAHVRNVIENSLAQLRQELNNQGIKVDRVGVYTGLADGQMPQGQGQEAWQQNSSHRGETHSYARGDADDYLDDIDGIAPAAVQESSESAGAADGVDYRV